MVGSYEALLCYHKQDKLLRSMLDQPAERRGGDSMVGGRTLSMRTLYEHAMTFEAVTEGDETDSEANVDTGESF